MKKLLVLVALVLVGCTAQDQAFQFGGGMHFKMDPCTKLVNVTWKGSNLWFLSRDMQPGEKPQGYEFSESSSWGVLNGVILISEQACEPGQTFGIGWKRH